MSWFKCLGPMSSKRCSVVLNDSEYTDCWKLYMCVNECQEKCVIWINILHKSCIFLSIANDSRFLFWQVSRFLNNIILIISKAVWKQLYPLSSAMRLWAWHYLLQPQMTPSTLVTASDFLFSMLTADLATVKSYCWKNIEGTQPSQSKSHSPDLSLLRQAGFPCCHGNGKDMCKGRAVRKKPQFRIVLTGVWRETMSSFLGDYLLYLHLSRTLTRDGVYPVAASVSPCRSVQ